MSVSSPPHSFTLQKVQKHYANIFVTHAVFFAGHRNCWTNAGIKQASHGLKVEETFLSASCIIKSQQRCDTGPWVAQVRRVHYDRLERQLTNFLNLRYLHTMEDVAGIYSSQYDHEGVVSFCSLPHILKKLWKYEFHLHDCLMSMFDK